MATAASCIIQDQPMEFTWDEDVSAFQAHLKWLSIALDDTGHVVPLEVDEDGNPQVMGYTGDIIALASETAASLQARIVADTRAAYDLPALPIVFIFDRRGSSTTP